MKEKFEFLSSTRFWAIVIAAVSIYAKTKGYIGEAEMVLISTIMAGFVTVKTVDRIGDKGVEAAEAKGGVTTVTMPSNVSTVTASKEVGD